MSSKRLTAEDREFLDKLKQRDPAAVRIAEGARMQLIRQQTQDNAVDEAGFTRKQRSVINKYFPEQDKYDPESDRGLIESGGRIKKHRHKSKKLRKSRRRKSKKHRR